MRCQNSSQGISRIISPQCYGEQATVQLTVIYHENPFNAKGVSSDTLMLCERCAVNVTADAESHGYAVNREELNVRTRAIGTSRA